MEADGILFNQSKQVPGKLIHLMGMMYLAWLEGRSVLKFDLIYCIRSTHMWFDGLKTNMFLRELELWIIIIRCMGPKNILIQYWMISVCKSSMINFFSSQSWYIYLIFSESEAQIPFLLKITENKADLRSYPYLEVPLQKNDECRPFP